MRKAGWSIVKNKNGDFKVYDADGTKYTYFAATGNWSRPLEAIEARLDQELTEIAEGRRSSFTAASRSTALFHSKNASQPIKWLAQKGTLRGKTVLHLGTGLDNPAKGVLLDSGCAEVADYDPNFYPDTIVLDREYDALIANYVLNIVPPAERREIYTQIRSSLKEGGCAYLTVQGVWPVKNKYKIIGEHQDGYLIQTGYNLTFRKGYAKQEFLDEIKAHLGGSPSLISMFYSNPFVQWVKPPAP
jgi:hypothetical protein